MKCFRVQLAKPSGSNPVVKTASAPKEDYCRAAGATHVIDYHSMPYNNAIPDAIHKITKGPLLIVYDVIFMQDTQSRMGNFGT